MAAGGARDSFSVLQEVDYIVGKAARRDARVVSIGPLVFFSTETGDAWVLDPADAAALCLARDGSPSPVRIVESERKFAIEWTRIVESERKFAIEWTCTYEINGEVMTFAEASGSVRSVMGYPTGEIAQAARRVLSS